MDRAEAYRREVEMLFRTWKEKNPLDGRTISMASLFGTALSAPSGGFPKRYDPCFY